MAHVSILRTYASRIDPNTLPPTIRLCHTDFSVSIFDLYPKSLFHFILIPFIRPPLRPKDLHDLRAVLQLPRDQAKTVLENIRRDALATKVLVEEEMVARYGFKWGVQIGFHAVPSLEYVPVPLKHLQHIHLHIISTEFRGTYMKNKKHLNSFHPTLGFFLHLDDVLSWFEPDVEPTWFAMKSNIDKKSYEKLLKEDLTCPGHCERAFNTMLKLNDHLREVFDKMGKAHKEKEKRSAAAASTDSASSTAETGTKRKLGEGPGNSDGEPTAESESQPAKRHQPDPSVQVA